MQFSPMNWEAFYVQVKRATGLDLSQYKEDQLQRRVAGMVDQKGLTNLEDFGKLVVSTPQETQWFLDKLAINVSELFRNGEKWKELEEKVLPELIRQSPRLKCWSAGCSYGAEAHSLAVVLDACFSGGHTIVGTDIDTAALEQARRGEFSDADVRGVPDRFRSRYFTRTGATWTAAESLKKYLSFKKGNLLADTFTTGFDLILCRNVVIYFTEPAKDELYRRFFEALKPGGVLFVGSTERIFRARELGYEAPTPFFYRKPLEGGQSRWRNAS